MSKSVNKVILVGNLGKDPDIKYTPSGIPVAKITVATNERHKGKNGEWQERAEWHNVVLWQRLAEISGEYLTKGSKAARFISRAGCRRGPGMTSKRIRRNT